MKIQKIISLFLTSTILSGVIFAQKGTRDISAESPNTPPQYTIVDIGTVEPTDSAVQGLGASAGGVGFGRSIKTGGSTAFSWTNGTGIAGLPNLSGRNFCLSVNGNDLGSIAGTCSTALSGTGRLPVIWQSGMVSQLPLPSGETLGDANDVNSNGVAVGSVNSGGQQRGVVYSGGVGTTISQTTAGGSFFRTASHINNAGRIIGSGIDPSNAARNVGIVYELGASQATEVGALPGRNGALAFGLSEAGHVVGSSMQNQGSGLPFIWTQGGGIVEIPLPTGTSSGSARAVNNSGWAVGTASSAFAIPFLYDGSATYRLGDLIPANSGWDLLTNTSSSAQGISNSGIIVGTGMKAGQIRAYAMIPVVATSLYGSVQTPGGRPLRNVTVTITGGSLPTPLMTTTSSFGYFSFEGILTGSSYTVTVSGGKVTFSNPSQVINVQGNDPVMIFTSN